MEPQEAYAVYDGKEISSIHFDEFEAKQACDDMNFPEDLGDWEVVEVMVCPKG